MKRCVAFLLALMLTATAFTGCSETVGEIAGNVADAAMEELENQVKAKLEEYKVDVVEIKTAVGKLNGSEGKSQFFCGVLVKAGSASGPESCAAALAKIFEDAGSTLQTGTKIESTYLEHKDLSFKGSNFEDGETYYLIYAYTSKLPTPNIEG